jgi:hypothetical protein
MKNPTILKDELSLLRADKSSVLTELRNSSKQLKEIMEEVGKQEVKRERVREDILEEMARLDEIKSRAIFVKDGLAKMSQDHKNAQLSYDRLLLKSSQENKLQLGRIKELKEQEELIIGEIGRLKGLFDKNSAIYNSHESERLTKMRDLNNSIAKKEKELKELTSSLEDKLKEDKKITKERLKREDKIRIREKNSEAKEFVLAKREEDLITMSKDMTIVYGRLKELYSKIQPELDLDKIILKAI